MKVPVLSLLVTQVCLFKNTNFVSLHYYIHVHVFCSKNKLFYVHVVNMLIHTVFCYWQKSKKSEAPTEPAPERRTSCYGAAGNSLTCLISEQSLALYEMLGNGAFGYVRRGTWMKNSHKKVNWLNDSIEVANHSHAHFEHVYINFCTCTVYYFHILNSDDQILKYSMESLKISEIWFKCPLFSCTCTVCMVHLQMIQLY